MKATGVTAGLAESNGSLLPGLWHDSLHVTCGLTACTPGSAPRAQRSVTSMGKLYLYLPERLLKQRNTDENVNIDCVILCATRAYISSANV